MYTPLADSWVELGLTEGKVTFLMRHDTKKLRIDISSGELNSTQLVILPLSSIIVVIAVVNLTRLMFFLTGSGLNDGLWHSVHLTALEYYAMLTVDGDEASTVRTTIPIYIQTGGTYYFGGDNSIWTDVLKRLLFWVIISAVVEKLTSDLLHFSPGYFLNTNTGSPQRSFQGCMQMIHVDDHPADLRAVEQGLIGSFENVSLDMCAIIDR